MELGFYPGFDGRFSPSTYRRKDRPTDPERDRSLIEDGIAAIADAIAKAGPDWHRSVTQRPSSEPDKIEYCLLSGDVLNSFPYPLGYDTSRAACLALVQKLLSTCRQRVDGQPRPRMKGRSLPDFVRVVDDTGEEVCRWSLDDL
jgi:hypothetical protein